MLLRSYPPPVRPLGPSDATSSSTCPGTTDDAMSEVHRARRTSDRVASNHARPGTTIDCDGTYVVADGRLIVACVTPTSRRILIVGLNYAPERTGIAPYTTALAEYLAQDGWDVRIITGFPHYPEWEIHPGFGGRTIREERNGVAIRRLRHFVPRRSSHLGRLHMELSFGCRAILQSFGEVDVVLCVSPSLFATALTIARWQLAGRKQPLAVWVQDLYSKGVSETGRANPFLVRGMAAIESWVLRSATSVSVIHQRFSAYLVEELRVDPEALRVIGNWSHVKSAEPADRDAVRRSYGWEPDETIVLHAGNMGMKQDLGNVVEAARLADGHPRPIRFVLLGNGNQREKIASEAEGATRLQMMDSLPDEQFVAALRAADILLVNELPGLRETAVPSKLTSYFSAGRPVLAATEADSITASEVLRAGGGVVVEPASPEALLRAVVALADDAARSEALSLAGLRYASEELSSIKALDALTEWIGSAGCHPPRGKR